MGVQIGGPPSGVQVELVHGDATATVVGVGGGLRAYGVAGRPVLDGYGPDELCSGGRGQLLVPWPNRIADGRYHFGGRDYQLELSEPAHGNAIHGLTRWADWELTRADRAGGADRADRAGAVDRVTARHVLPPRPGYPFRLGCEAAYSLGPAGLAVQVSLTNLASTPAPAGFGIHPYVTVGTALVDDASLTIPARTRLVTDERGIPAGAEPVAGSEFDFSAPRRLGSARLDTAYTDLVRDADGLVRVTLRGPDGARSVTVWADGAFGYLQVFTGDTLAPAARRRGIAIEPMTCAPDAFRTGAGLAVLAPGERLVGTWGIQPGP